MKKKELKKLIKAVDSTDPKAIMSNLMGNDKVDHKDIGAITKLMEELGITVNDFKVMTAVRKELTKKVLKGITSWSDVLVLIGTLEDKHDLTTDQFVVTIRRAMKRAELIVPRKPTLGAVKQAIVEYVVETDSPTPDGLKKHLLQVHTFDKDKKVNAEKAQHAVSMNFSFAMAIIQGHEVEAGTPADETPEGEPVDTAVEKPKKK